MPALLPCLRLIMAPCVLSLALICAAPGARAADALDLGALPRIAGSTVVAAVGPSLIYESPQAVDATGKAVRDLLTAEGWKVFQSPPYDPKRADRLDNQWFVKGANAISAYTSAAPARNNATVVQYSILPIAEPLPLPDDATEVAIDMSRPHVECATAKPADDTFEFYRSGLSAAGWQRFTPPTPPATNLGANGGAKTKRAHFIKENRNPLLLMVVPVSEGRTSVYVKEVPHAEMIAEYAPKPEPTPAAAPPPTPAEPKGDEMGAKIDELVGDLIKQALQPPKKPAKNTASTADGDAAPLQPLAGNTAPIPVPATAEGIEHEGEDGTFEFSIASSVASVAGFYRKEMPPLGWKEKRSVINKENMVVLNFAKGDDELTMTIMRMGDHANVDARGDALKTKADAGEEASGSSADGESSVSDFSSDSGSQEKTYALADLEVEDAQGLPVPKPHNSIGHTKSKFLYASNATVEASFETIIACYRRELEKRGWKEDASAAVTGGKVATLKFASPEGPAVLKLTHETSGETGVELTVHQKAPAEASGMMPKPGQVRVMLGTILDTPSEVTIDDKKLKVKPGDGQGEMPGPNVEVAPGKHKITWKTKGKGTQTDEAEFGGDEIWGVLIGPGGILPLQMY